MPKRLLSQATRATIVRLHQNGMSNAAIIRALPNKGLTFGNVGYVIRAHGHKGSGASFQNNPGQGRPPTRLQLKRRVEKKILRDPRLTIAKLARDHNVSWETMKRIVNVDLGYTSYRRFKCQALNADAKAKRLARAQVLLTKGAAVGWENVIWSDEKLFSVDESFNRQNSRVLGKKKKTILSKYLRVARHQKPTQVTSSVSGSVSISDPKQLF